MAIGQVQSVKADSVKTIERPDRPPKQPGHLLRAGFQAQDLPIALWKGETGHLPGLPEERSQVGTHEKDQAHND
ncbi:hypothetical protein HKBW3S42_00079 [Candidatus Hakubella thermalkaliphila]|uniref:Uncharacterized protein n=1 Tax=Candidatus Hakubella thermalkaliphila TaxID=2754717 RepID=A0A6V8QBP1_9ACTN|nr:hypothetical protein HKBW3S06_00799 [Candidatus Hakubella thermalkaliphila]GFP24976.1 hypothetical protein HKBW3S25_00414 [Candidatus Hakubella thermalkaliphila]GFP26683.1 hypothetical protein HKBW3S33_00098 [Candidatus Hakubella thermalkaliphila]GFP31772.1 hypothetical protein HKBW3S42_00079 [Candidatus Hakubella thermalkaliphila]GFP35028.1 hypothetical protein HKBW3S43_00820 [Candidatus Hakubella thermalkaliphila]